MEDLPTEIIIKIANYLPWKSYIELCHTSKKLYFKCSNGEDLLGTVFKSGEMYNLRLKYLNLMKEHKILKHFEITDDRNFVLDNLVLHDRTGLNYKFEREKDILLFPNLFSKLILQSKIEILNNSWRLPIKYILFSRYVIIDHDVSFKQNILVVDMSKTYINATEIVLRFLINPDCPQLIPYLEEVIRLSIFEKEPLILLTYEEIIKKYESFISRPVNIQNNKFIKYSWTDAYSILAKMCGISVTY